VNSSRSLQSLEVSRLVTGMISASRLDKAFYARLKREVSLSQDAWVAMVLACVATNIGADIFEAQRYQASRHVAILHTLWYTVGGLVGFYLWTFMVTWVSNSFFRGQSDYGEVRRLVGFAYAPLVLWAFSWLPGDIGPLIALAGIAWSLVTRYFAVKEALGSGHFRAILTSVLSLLLMTVVIAVIAIAAVLATHAMGVSFGIP